MDEGDFLKKMGEVDQLLAREQVPIHQRQFRAYLALSPNYRGLLGGAGVNLEDYPDFVGPNLLKRVGDWYINRYGDRAYVPTVLGKVPILIRGQVYLVKIPILFGRVRFDVEKVISLIEGLARSMVDSLTTLEKKQLVDAFFAGYAFVYELEDLRTVCFGQLPNATVRILESALEDRDSAIDALIRPFPNTNNACFHAHQHAEKMLKGFFLSRGGVGEEHLKNRFGHSLEKLFRECLKQRTAFQQAKADIELLKQVSMEVRYTADKSSVETACNLIWAALRVGGLAACEISGLPRRYNFNK